MMPPSAQREHQPVLLAEVLARLGPRSGEVHVDSTLGTGGHGAAILSRLGPTGLLIGIDRDKEALEVARSYLESTGLPFRLQRGLYSELKEYFRLFGLPPQGAVDGLLLDLGVSSLQLDRPERGFSFLNEGPLDMRMAPGEGERAAEFLERASLDEIEGALRNYGDEPASTRIARAIDRARKEEKIKTTGQLARIVEGVLPRKGKKTHP